MSLWCTCLFSEMQFSWCGCPIGACRDANAPCRDAMTQMSHWEYAMMRMLWCKHDLFKNSLYFRPEASTMPKTKIFSKLDLLFMKSHLPFDLRLPKKNWWSLLKKSSNGASTWNLMIWLKRFIIWLSKRGGTFPKPFSGKMNSLKIKHLKKIHFLVPKYGNLIGVKTHRDRFGNSTEGILEQRVQIFGFGKGRGPHRGFECCLVVALSFFCLLRPWDFKKFLIFALDCLFRVFTLESCFFFSFFLLSSIFIVLLCTWKFKIHPKQVKDWSRFFFLAEEKRRQPCWLWKISQGQTSSVQVSTFNQNGLFRYVM